MEGKAGVTEYRILKASRTNSLPEVAHAIHLLAVKVLVAARITRADVLPYLRDLAERCSTLAAGGLDRLQQRAFEIILEEAKAVEGDAA